MTTRRRVGDVEETPDSSANVKAPGPDAEGRWVWRLIAAMAVLAALGWSPGMIDNPHAAAPNVTWLLLLPFFAAAEILVIHHLPAVRSSHSHTLREVPAIAGLAFLAPQQYLTVYVIGASLALLVWVRMRGVKLAF